MEQKVIVQDNGSATWKLNGVCESAEIPVMIINPEKAGKKYAVETVIKHAPADYCGLFLSKVRFESYDSDGNINMIAVYEGRETEDEEASLSFSAGGGSMHITEALEQILVYSDSDAPEVHKNAGLAIGWNGAVGDEMQIAGVDIPAPAGKETYTKIIPLSRLTTNYKRKAMSLIGKVNANKFKGWNAGEMLLENVSFTAPEKGDNTIQVSFDFQIRPNEKDFNCNGVKLDKRGFEYVWAITKARKKKDDPYDLGVSAIYKAQVIAEADFSVLGI